MLLPTIEWVISHSIVYWEWVMQMGTTSYCVILMDFMNKLFQVYARGVVTMVCEQLKISKAFPSNSMYIGVPL